MDGKAAEFKSKTIPKKTRQLAESIAKEAKSFRMAMASNSGWFDEAYKGFEEERARLQRLKDIAADRITNEIATLKRLGPGLKQDATVAGYVGGATNGFHQSVRGVGAALRNLSGDPKLADFKEKTGSR